MSRAELIAAAKGRHVADDRDDAGPGPEPGTGTVTVHTLPIARCRANALNVRRDLGDLRALAATIADVGVVLPIVVRAVGSGWFEVVDGHRRLAASHVAGRRTIPAVVRRLDRRQGLVASLHTGLTARVLDRAERRDGLRILIDRYGATVAEIATSCGVGEGTVRAWLRRDADQPDAATATARPRRRPVPRRALVDLVDRWADLAASGLDADEAHGLFDDLRALIDEHGGRDDPDRVSS